MSVTCERVTSYRLRGKPEIGDTFTAADREYTVVDVSAKVAPSGKVVDVFALRGRCTSCGKPFYFAARRGFWPNKRCGACR